METESTQVDESTASGEGTERVAVYLDEDDAPIAEYAPPARVSLDTRQLEDGVHELRFEAKTGEAPIGRRNVSFEVRNGPAISVEGLRDGDVVNGELDIVVHAWGGAPRGDWEPRRAESPAPIPTWAWLLLLGIIAWATYYGIVYWQPSQPYRDSPTYRSGEAEPSGR